MQLPKLNLITKLGTGAVLGAFIIGGSIGLSGTKPTESHQAKLTDSTITAPLDISTNPQTVNTSGGDVKPVNTSATNSTPSVTGQNNSPTNSNAGSVMQPTDSNADSTPSPVQQTIIVPPVTAVSATFAWGATSSPDQYGNNSEQGTCTYAYSDGTTQIVNDGTITYFGNGGEAQTGGNDCIVADAPAGL